METGNIKDINELKNWLKNNYKLTTGVWLVYNKTIAHPLIVDELLSYGWIDSTKMKFSETQSKLYISPRKPKSLWSRVNKEKIEVLIKENRMQPSGMAMVNLAKKTGTWDALNDVENTLVPNDLQLELKKYSNATKNFEDFPRSAKKVILQWILTAKRPETRLSRIQLTAQKAQENIRAKIA